MLRARHWHTLLYRLPAVNVMQSLDPSAATAFVCKKASGLARVCTQAFYVTAAPKGQRRFGLPRPNQPSATRSPRQAWSACWRRSTALQASLQRPITHLRALSPHVEALLSEPAVTSWQGQSGSLTRGVSVPRQTAPSAVMSSEPSAASASCLGISAFAFQGTNAHALVQQRRPVHVSDVAANGYAELHWRKRAHWVAPLTGLLAQRVISVTGFEVTIQMQLQQPGTAALLDHRIQVGCFQSCLLSLSLIKKPSEDLELIKLALLRFSLLHRHQQHGRLGRLTSVTFILLSLN